ncbi:hypothetical protein C0Q70_15437 [Pomacea canaliculata]|uniref:WW domain-containing protein n=1 Tax=Pomacea canaliculata TaxID=400727 RepID=A0A2T7NUU9_POMCA|nr:hypothetical protein C0Q70_15437 [Pomacea canaliculata]
MGELGWCRPPQPLPEVPLEDEVPYYSTPRPYRDHLDELKLMLRESEMCDCGLRMVDAELADGWTVHRSRESNTFKRVFYQHENGNTTWVFPSSIITFLSFDKICFILRLCKDSGQEPPGEIMAQYAQETNARGTRPFPSAQPSTTNSPVNRIWSQTLPNSGRGSEPLFSARNITRNATLDQRRPLPLPESTKL